MAKTLAFITGTGTVFLNGTVENSDGVIATRPATVYSFVLVGGGGSGTARLYNSSNSTGTVATMAVGVVTTNVTTPNIIPHPVYFNQGVLCTMAGTGNVAHVIFE